MLADGTLALGFAMLTTDVIKIVTHLTKPPVHIICKIGHPGEVGGSGGWRKGGAVGEGERFEIAAAVRPAASCLYVLNATAYSQINGMIEAPQVAGVLRTVMIRDEGGRIRRLMFILLILQFMAMLCQIEELSWQEVILAYREKLVEERDRGSHGLERSGEDGGGGRAR
ncbi:aminotransferase class I/II-fold pyridoxal phosphate-dependent enzyme [Babesia caballi]|uniref:Aminotransferase class I/II-fold pyridoxal phosphate-dependent enzyme n=1 Tax=Babesia caballi TaxID=5871 RepID=A0AAV4LRS4_BABCB|nr:aminotransferase class I/II-fold pyridoxal phosphate-dependent enzyme [Babesia caballi]